MKTVAKSFLAVASGVVVSGFAASVVMCDVEWFLWWAWFRC